MTVVSNFSQLPATLRSLSMPVATVVAAILSTAVANAQATTIVHFPPEKSIAHLDFTPVRVMTRNVYDGLEPGDYRRLREGEKLSEELEHAVDKIICGEPLRRAALHASEIALEHPDLLAIQEAVVAQNGDRRVNMLEALLEALQNLNTPYEVIVSSQGLHIESGNVQFFVQNAILVRSDLVPPDLILSNQNQGLYKASLSVTMPAVQFAPDDAGQPGGTKMNFRRNWMFVDVQLRGHRFRFVTTHLDFLPGQPQPARQQAAELMPIVSNTRMPVIIAGDFNYPYEAFTSEDSPGFPAAAFRDAWVTTSGPDVNSLGPVKATCCHEANTWGTYSKCSPWTRTEKIDLILLRRGVSSSSTRLVGAVSPTCSPEECTLLASDHAGVVSDLVFNTATSSRRSRVRSQ
jgi:endonuclease/exonuclease/phosphatase family metal-dependent hydrolase